MGTMMINCKCYSCGPVLLDALFCQTIVTSGISDRCRGPGTPPPPVPTIYTRSFVNFLGKQYLAAEDSVGPIVDSVGFTVGWSEYHVTYTYKYLGLASDHPGLQGTVCGTNTNTQYVCPVGGSLTGQTYTLIANAIVMSQRVSSRSDLPPVGTVFSSSS